MNKSGFTLAEVMIVLAVIGVIATLTIPTLMQNYKNRVMMTQLQKAYAELSQAGSIAISNSNADSFQESKPYKNNTFLRDYIKNTKDCGASWEVECALASEYITSDGYTKSVYSVLDIGSIPPYCVIAKSGYSICLTLGNGLLDVNAHKGPNKIGQDAFKISFKADGTVDEDYSVELSNIVNNDWSYDY